MRQLRGKVAVVTGAASGIGAALSLHLARAGCALALVDVQAERLRRTAAAAREQGAQVSSHVVDVSDASAMRALAEAVLAFHGSFHLVINNAGVTVAAPFSAHSLADCDWILGVNLRGVIHGCHVFLPHLLAQREGHIVNISSIFGVIGVPAQSAYCATKFAVRGLSEALWEELAGTGVQVTVVHPGGVNTDIIRAARTSDEAARSRLAHFFAHKTLSPERAAERIVQGILRDQRRILIGPEAHLLDALKRLLPATGNRLAVRALLRSLGMADLTLPPPGAPPSTSG